MKPYPSTRLQAQSSWMNYLNLLKNLKPSLRIAGLEIGTHRLMKLSTLMIKTFKVRGKRQTYLRD